VARTARIGHLDVDLYSLSLLLAGGIAFFIFILVLSATTPERIVVPKGKEWCSAEDHLTGKSSF
jgi:hypothetical protein